MKSTSNYSTEVIISIKEYEQLLGYKEAWRKFRRWLNIEKEDELEISDKMTEILKQCTKNIGGINEKRKC